MSELLDAAIEVIEVVSDRVVVELKAVEALAPIHWSMGFDRSYLKATGSLRGLLIDFNVPVLLRGVRRIILTPCPGVLALT